MSVVDYQQCESCRGRCDQFYWGFFSGQGISYCVPYN